MAAKAAAGDKALVATIMEEEAPAEEAVPEEETAPQTETAPEAEAEGTTDAVSEDKPQE
jgi:hypothetical protein